MDFLSFFGLKEDPFKLTPDPAYFYPSSSHNEGLLLMEYSVDQKEGFLLVIGDPGTGKTTLLKVFLDKWKDRADIAMVLTPRLSPEEFLVAVAEDLNINLVNKNKNDTIKALRDFMTEKSLEDRRVIIIVDEAQNLPPDTLEELRLLSNLETDKDKLIQIILIGQPELETNLKTVRLRQLNQRITTRIHLEHFNLVETDDYINFRAIKAGKENLQIHKRSSRLVFKLSKGTPRLINMLVSRALMAAYLEENNVVLPNHISHAMKSLNHSEINTGNFNKLIPVSAGLFSALLIAGAIYFYTQNINARKTGPTEISASPARSPDTVALANKAQDNKNLPPVETVSSIERKAIPEYKLATVKVNVALIRYKPSVESGKAGWILKGNQLIIINESRDSQGVKWFQVHFQGETRWISEEVVDVINPGKTAAQKPELSVAKSEPGADLTETPDL